MDEFSSACAPLPIATALARATASLPNAAPSSEALEL
jgi:hypothetical protein